MLFRGMTAALAAMLAFGVTQAEAASSRETRAKPARAAAAPVARATGPAVRPVERFVGGRSEARGRVAMEPRGRIAAEARGRGAMAEARGRWVAEPRGRSTVEARGRGVPEARGRLAEARGRNAPVSRGWIVAGSRGRLDSRGRTVARLEDRRGGRGMTRDRWQAEAPVASYRTVGLFSRPAVASTLRDEGEERRGGGKMARSARGAWHAGLPAADGEQTACPPGTMSVMARGHSETFRCMPI